MDEDGTVCVGLDTHKAKIAVAVGDAELQEIVLGHNLTPRKCLGFLTPLQALLKELGRDVQIRFA